MEELGLKVIPKRVRQIINAKEHLKSAKMMLAPCPKNVARLEFAKQNMGQAWNLVIF